MRKNSVIIAVSFFLVFVLSGCAAWQKVENNSAKWTHENLEATLPRAWMRLNFTGKNMLLLTKDGELLQSIVIYSYKISDDKEDLPLTKVKLKKDMLIQEIADALVNEMSTDQTKRNFKLRDNEPVLLSGKEAFKLEFIYDTPDNLRIRCIEYGFKNNDALDLIMYQAAAQYYFDKDVTVFQKFLSDFKIL